MGVTVIDRMKNKEVSRRAGMERELVGRVDQRGSRWFEHVEKICE